MIRKFSTSNILFASLGIASLFYFSVGLVIALDRELLGKWMLITSPVLGAVGNGLNIRGLKRFSQGVAGEYDLVLTWPGLFSAFFAFLFSTVRFSDLWALLLMSPD